jgi:hypothetical protein
MQWVYCQSGVRQNFAWRRSGVGNARRSVLQPQERNGVRSLHGLTQRRDAHPCQFSSSFGLSEAVEAAGYPAVSGRGALHPRNCHFERVFFAREPRGPSGSEGKSRLSQGSRDFPKMAQHLGCATPFGRNDKRRVFAAALARDGLLLANSPLLLSHLLDRQNRDLAILHNRGTFAVCYGPKAGDIDGKGDDTAEFF